MNKLTSFRLEEGCKLIARGLGADQERIRDSKEINFLLKVVYIKSIFYVCMSGEN